VQVSRFKRILLETLLLPVVALLGVSGVLAWQILRAERTVAQMQIADRNITAAMHIETLIVSQETGLRGYQNTADETFLQPYLDAAAPLQKSFETLHSRIASQHGDLRSLDTLEYAHRRWIEDVAVPLIAMVHTGSNTRDLGMNLRAKASMDGIRTLEDRVFNEQKAKRNDLVESWKQQVNHTLETIVICAVAMGLLIGFFARSRLHLVSIAFRATIEEQRRTQAALLGSEKLAVAGRLAATIAHEIHNPLDSVVNLLYLMKQDPTDAERDEFVDLAQAELARVTQISRAMLGLYRESRTPVALDLSELVRSVLILLDHQVNRCGLTVDMQLAPNAIATGYPAELRQVFTNLLSNAAEASEPGGTITVRVSRRGASRGALQDDASDLSAPGVLVCIQDHGRGIAVADRQRLFHPFFTTKGEHGTGLGLWVSHGIVQKHSGSIHVETSTDPATHGTTMTVFLPRGEADFTYPAPRALQKTLL
jgi:signal transduction histidine kinase